jgi:hypothetical protein
MGKILLGEMAKTKNQPDYEELPTGPKMDQIREKMH